MSFEPFYASVDQMGYPLVLKSKPKRIISLVPSQTELLFDLGLEEEIVGVTKFCVHPSGKRKSRKVIGGTKNFNFNRIDQLEPDLIIGNKEENYKEGILILKEKYPVFMSDIESLEQACAMMESVGALVDKEERSAEIVRKIKFRFEDLKPRVFKRALYLIWKNPYMSIGKDTFIHEMMNSCGLENVLGNAVRYPVLAENEIRDLQPDIILLSSEPFPFKEKHIAEIKKSFPSADVALVDGEMFSWYGSRLLYSAAYFKQIYASMIIKDLK